MSAEPDADSNPVEIDSMASEAVELFVKLMHDAGYDLNAIAEIVVKSSQREPLPPIAIENELRNEPVNIPHLLTLWYTESEYLDAKGNPRPLPKSGPGASVESLLKIVNPSLDLEEAMRFFLRTDTLAEENGLYVPRRRTVSLRGTGLATRQRHLRIVVGLMRTCQRNNSSRNQSESWYEFAAENAALPVSAVPLLRTRTFQTAEQFLSDEDGRMHRAAALRKPDEPIIKRCVGVFEFEETCLPLETAPKDGNGT